MSYLKSVIRYCPDVLMLSFYKIYTKNPMKCLINETSSNYWDNIYLCINSSTVSMNYFLNYARHIFKNVGNTELANNLFILSPNAIANSKSFPYLTYKLSKNPLIGPNTFSTCDLKKISFLKNFWWILSKSPNILITNTFSSPIFVVKYKYWYL